MLDGQLRSDFEAAFISLLLRFGAREDDLKSAVTHAVDEAVAALVHSANDGASLSALTVLRIRAGKFAATRVPATVYRDRAQLLLLRSEIQRLSVALLTPHPATTRDRSALAQQTAPSHAEGDD